MWSTDEEDFHVEDTIRNLVADDEFDEDDHEDCPYDDPADCAICSQYLDEVEFDDPLY